MVEKTEFHFSEKNALLFTSHVKPLGALRREKEENNSLRSEWGRGRTCQLSNSLVQSDDVSQNLL